MEAFQSGASTSRPRDSSRDGAPDVVEARCKRLPLETRQSLVVAGSVRAWFGALAALTETGGGAHLESMSCDSPQKSTRSASLRSFTWCDSGMIAIGRAAARVAHRARWRRVCATRLMTEAEGRESWSPGARVEVRVARVKDIPLEPFVVDRAAPAAFAGAAEAVDRASHDIIKRRPGKNLFGRFSLQVPRGSSTIYFRK